ncbi:hypothetical protein D030_0601B, partial [Vibrio parahaemolyticus AQ3810]
TLTNQLRAEQLVKVQASISSTTSKQTGNAEYKN